MISAKERAKYWSNAADCFGEHTRDILKGDGGRRWYDLIMRQYPADKKLKILDCGCGAGFFSILLGKGENKVIGIDRAEGMLEMARANAALFGANAEFLFMDLENIEYSDNEFDLVLSRYVTWNLSDPESVYKEWKRILKPGGVLLIFDADYFTRERDPAVKELAEQARLEYIEKYGEPEEREHDSDINKDHAHVELDELPLTGKDRPGWDESFLKSIGFSEVMAVSNINAEIYDKKEQLLHKASPMFMVKAVK